MAFKVDKNANFMYHSKSANKSQQARLDLKWWSSLMLNFTNKYHSNVFMVQY